MDVRREASSDTPGLAATLDQTFEEWRIFAIERPSRDLELTFLAVVDGRVVGVAYLETYGVATSPASSGNGAAAASCRR
jgi:hypothetical protein